MERLNMISSIIDQSLDFIQNVYIADLLAVAPFYKDWLFGGGISSKNLMSYGEFPKFANDQSAASLMLPRGAILGGKLDTVIDVDLRDPAQVQEFVTHSWYKYADESKGLHPWDGVTEPNFALGGKTKGTKTKLEALDEAAKYSWVKAPRWKGNAMEVGPLARMVIAYVKKDAGVVELIDSTLKTLGVPITALFSTLGRTAARGLECLWAAQKLRAEFDKLIANLKAGDLATASTEKWEPRTWPTSAKGVGFCEAPRGALGHWIHIENTKIANYQAVVPTTWNGSPRDPAGNIGAFEAALMDTPLADPEKPLEILRTIHSFDPCLACATHVIAPDGTERSRVTVR
jgi:hydrogenase large subunit